MALYQKYRDGEGGVKEEKKKKTKDTWEPESHQAGSVDDTAHPPHHQRLHPETTRRGTART